MRIHEAVNVLALVASLVALLPGEAWPQGNYVANARFHVWRERGPVSVPEGGRWFPEHWRIAPGKGAAARAALSTMTPADSGQGLELYVKWVRHQYDPFVEPGQAWLEHHIFEYDQLIGQTVLLTWWQKVDGCYVPVVPMLWVNYHNGDYEFLSGAGYLVSQRDVGDRAGYQARLLAAPSCRATTAWQQCAMIFQLPEGAGHAVDNNRYVAIGLNFQWPTAPGIHIAHMELTRPWPPTAP